MNAEHVFMTCMLISLMPVALTARWIGMQLAKKDQD